MHLFPLSMKKKRHAAAFACGCLAFLSALTIPVQNVQAASGYEETADFDEATEKASVLSYGMTPIYGQSVADGTYEVNVASSSKYFRLDYAVLTVENGVMTAEVHFDSTAYDYVYPGTPEEAAAADLSDYIPCEDTGTETIFTFSVDALNAPLACAAFSNNRNKWYGRYILFEASSLPEDALDVVLPDYDLIEDSLEAAGYDTDALMEDALNGIVSDDTDETAEISSGDADNSVLSSSLSDGVLNADVTYVDEAAVSLDLADGEYSIEADMTGGSGRATISSPMLMTIKDGRAYATVTWSSTYYDYMIVNGVKYLKESDEGTPSSFTIPILETDEPFDVIADTTAMGDPVEITYTLTFYYDTIGSKGMIPQEAAKRVLVVAGIVIVVGAVVNHLIKKRKAQ